MKILVACERTGKVRDAFYALGHNAWSCDLQPTVTEGQHLECSVLQVLNYGWDMMIAFPPCTHLCVSGAKHFEEKRKDGRQKEGIDFFMAMVNSGISKIAIENPIGIMSSEYRKPDQIIQPWMFGHGETKATCLWLKNLLPLCPTHASDDLFIKNPEPIERENRIHKMAPSPERSNLRSETYSGIAQAMADQWGR